MSYRVPENDILNYYKEGYIVFRGILPSALIGDLRRECDKAQAIARRLKGAQAQRLQPIQKYESELNLQPFRNYTDLPDLHDAMAQVLTPEHSCGKLDVMGILLEPEREAWCTDWHRDMTLATSRLPVEQFHALMLDWHSANQVNCALYEDDCTWFVPGSHLRMRDLPGELAAAKPPAGIGWSKEAREARWEDPVAKESACLNYSAGMPGAIQLRLHPGDFALYRPLGWHLGCYVPYRRRATLHDAVFTPKYETWWREWIKGGSPVWTPTHSQAA